MPVWMAIALIVAMLVAGAIGLVRERTRPAADPDAVVLAELQKAGSDLSQPHKVEFFLLFGTFEGVKEAAGELAKAGFETHADSEAIDGRWSCVATKTLVPEREALHLIRAQLSGLAGRLGGQYDGWGAAVRRAGR
jgi:regulator of RNase E activity RraB